MKKIIASVGVAAVGISAVQVATAAGVGVVDPSRPWSVSCALRGFYDDNYVTAPKGQERDSLGISVSPSLAYNLPLDQTTLGLRYTFGANWYQDRKDQNSANDPWDLSHQFDAFLNHNFSERYTLDVTESFVMSQEPGLLATTTGGTVYPYRTEGNNIRNYGQATFVGALTRQLSFVLGYQNTYYNYENSGGNYVTPSLSGLLDRIEQTGLVNLRWQALPQTVFVLGYNYGVVDYTSDEQILNPSLGYPVTTSKARNNRSHTIYAGLDQNFSKDLLLTVRGGAEKLDSYNDPFSDTGITPYGQINLTYNYLPGSSVQVGWTLSQNQTDIFQPVSTNLYTSFTSAQLSSVLYASVNHRFDGKLSGRLSGSWQNSKFEGGLYDSQRDNFLDLGLNLSYRFNQHFSGEVGYDFYWLSSDIPNRDYDRNLVYIGVVAAY